MKYRHQMIEAKFLRPNPWNPNKVDEDAAKKLDASLKRFGVFKPIIVRLVDDEFEIIGGQHRWESAKRLGIETVPIVNLGKLDDTLAKEISLADNARWGHDDTELLASLLHDIDMEILTTVIPMNTKEIDAILSMKDIDLDSLNIDDGDDIDLAEEVAGRPTPTHQIMRFKVPIEDAELLSEKIRAVCKTEGFTESDALTNAGDALIYLLGDLGG